MTESDADRPEHKQPINCDRLNPLADPTAPLALRKMDEARRSGVALNQFGVEPTIIGDSRDVLSAGARAGNSDDGGPPRTVPYIVQKGETLWSISESQQTDNGNRPRPAEVMAGVDKIVNASRLPGRLEPLREGQKIKIPETIRTGFRQEGRETPGAPTALVLDDFSSKGTTIGAADTSHGGILTAGFNAMGFNVIRANLPDVAPLKHTSRFDFSAALSRAANFIDANPDRFKPSEHPENRSFLNTSFGNNEDPRDKDSGDFTYKQLSKLVGLDVNSANMKINTNEVLRRLDLVAQGKNPITEQCDWKISKHDREIAGAAVRTNQQIQRIQDKGVEVVHSAGNDGGNRIDINFLRATQLRADAPHGDKPLKFSGIGSHTEHGAGVLPFHFYDKHTLVADIHGYMLRAPVDKSVKFDRRDHIVNYDALVRGDRHEFEARRTGQQVPWDVEGYNRGYAQRTYGLGPVVDYAVGTSFSPLSYIARTRQVVRPPEP